MTVYEGTIVTCDEAGTRDLRAARDRARGPTLVQPLEGGAPRIPGIQTRRSRVQEALNLYTRNAAWSSFDDGERGSHGTGKIADMVLLDRNPLATPPAELRSIAVKEVFLTGRPYRPGQGRADLLARGLVSRRSI